VMVALAFCIPLALVTLQVAEGRAMTEAREAAGSMVTVLAATDDPAAVRRAVAADHVGAQERLAVHLPDEVIGVSHVETSTVSEVAGNAETTTLDLGDGEAYLRTVLLPDNEVAVVEVYVPDTLATKGVRQAWLTLLGVALLLVAVSVIMADRLGAKVVRVSRALSEASAAFGAGDLSVRVKPDGPGELVEAGLAFNMMADRVVRLVDAERELAADLSHRLRTPLTALRLDSEALGDGQDAQRIRTSVDALEAEVDAVIAGARQSVTDRSAQHCDVAEVLRERMNMWSVLAEDHGRGYSLVGLDDALWVNIPRDDVLSCVDALVGNVFAHTPQNVPFRVLLDVVDGRLVVEDAGPGIADPTVALRRGESGAGSSGLGLDIVWRVATTRGGKLHVGRSQLGGARIVWTFGDAVRRSQSD
ncbi:MAG: sensor histidine kinase, partial [Stackebrandtia sp.]